MKSSDIEIVNGVIPGKKPTKEEVQDLWDSPISHKSSGELNTMVANAKDKKPTKKQLEMFEKGTK